MNVQELLDANNLHGYYPSDWGGFIGQDDAKRMLRIAAKSSAIRDQPMEHALLAAGTPGVGKTTLALLAAAETGRGFKIVSGQMDSNRARITLSQMNDGDVLFIDEIHQLVSGGKAKAEWLLHLMTDGVIMGPGGPEKQPRVTIVAATTDAGRLPETILSRFPVRPPITDYSVSEATLIAATMGRSMLPSEVPWPDTASFQRIAIAADLNPRIIRNVLIHVRDIELVEPGCMSNGRSYDLSPALRLMGRTHDGLTYLAMEYLTVLMDEFAGQAGGRTMQERLDEPGGLAAVESQLLRRSLIRKTSKGRVITGDGITRINKEAAA